MALNQSRLNRSKDASKSGGGGLFFKTKNGKNHLRVFSFKHKVTQADFDRGLLSDKETKVGKMTEELERLVPVHFRDTGSVNCLGSKCSFCAEANDFAGSDDEKDKRMYRQLQARKQFYLNIVNTEDPDKGIQVCGLPPSVFSEIVAYVLDPEYGEDVLGPEGRDFVITKDTTQRPADMYDVKLRDKERSAKLPEELLDTTHDLFTMTALDAGWSSSNKDGADNKKPKEDESPREDRNRRQAREEANEDPPPRRASRPENDLKDDAAGGDADDLPWEDPKASRRAPPEPEAPKPRPKAGASAPAPKEELEDWMEKGEPVEFTDKKGNVIKGVIESVNVDDKTIGVETDEEVWDIKYSEARKPAKKRRAS